MTNWKTIVLMALNGSGVNEQEARMQIRVIEPMMEEYLAEQRKEVMEKKDDLLDDIWGLVCNVNGGMIEKEKEDWYKAFLRIREKYHNQLNHHD